MALRAINLPFTKDEIYITLDIIAIAKTNYVNPAIRQSLYDKISKQFFYLITPGANKPNIDPDNTQLTNLFSLIKIQEKGYKTRLLDILSTDQTLSYDDIVSRHETLLGLIIKTIDPTKRKIFGNTQFNAQLVLSDITKQEESYGITKFHNLTVVKFTDCVDKLKVDYNLNDILVVKTEEKYITGNKIQNNVTVSYYNLYTRDLLDGSKCNKKVNTLDIPVLITPEEKKKYIALKEKGIDIYNPHDPAFRTRCASIIDPETDYDTTLTFRLDNFFRNATECEDNGCVYKSLDPDGYINCSCDSDDVEAVSSGGSGNILACGGEIKLSEHVNAGLIVALILAISQLIATGALIYLRRGKQKYLAKLLHHDCVLFDVDKVSFAEYFIRPDVSVDVKPKQTVEENRRPSSVNNSNTHGVPVVNNNNADEVVANNLPASSDSGGDNTRLSRHTSVKNSIKSQNSHTPSVKSRNSVTSRKSVNNIIDNVATERKDGEFDTTRYLKEDTVPAGTNIRSPELRRPSENKNLRLHENFNEFGLEQNNNTINDAVNNTNKLVDDEKNDEVKIYNNFLDHKSSDITNNNTDGQATQSGFGVFRMAKEVTMMDIESLGHDERFMYDRRTLSQYLWDSLTRRNIVLSIVFKYSVIDPSHIRVAKIVFAITLIFGFNAILFEDYYMDQRAMATSQVIKPINLLVFLFHLNNCRIWQDDCSSYYILGYLLFGILDHIYTAKTSE
jgi:hypothetical protein